MNGNVLRKLVVIQQCQMYMIEPKPLKFCVLFFEKAVLVVKLSVLKVQSKDDNTIGMLKIKRNNNIRPKGLLSMNFAAKRGLFFHGYLHDQRCLQ